MPVSGNTIREPWLYLDLNDAPLVGMASPADVSLTLKYDPGTGTITATETVTWVERGSGFYDIVFTPLNSGRYTLYVKELNANSSSRRFEFPYEIGPAGAVFVPGYAGAFCSEPDVERWTQLLFDSGSKPTSDQVSAFAVARASEMRIMLGNVGLTVTPGDQSLNGTPLLDMLREANAMSAAADALRSKFRDIDPSRTAQADDFEAHYQIKMQTIQAYAVAQAGSTGAANENSSDDSAFIPRVGMDDLY